ncbi:RNA polymerase sigma factor [Microbacterium dauci]|uniref:RNA polymerase sigma factor n=1 Tax=Microbacterium dauci TaxID=3048008 RepID=A0ABT6ZGQ3_9MICO|nr:RNA polymerase sigma factor [Microbacterium sp. LX3-4]MDJ1115156.1 RNA polymerase sigma factor [Microbacterium sp. LX3-4]
MTTDSGIIRRSLSEPSAFAEVFERHATAIARFAAQRVGTDAGQDVVSETFLIAFRRRGSFDHSWESAKPWLFGIATRVIHRMRGQDAKQWRAIAAAASVAIEHGDDLHERAEAHADADAALRPLAARIAALPTRDRDVLLLYAWGDMTYEQIAIALSVPVGTVRSRLNRVRRRLRADGVEQGREGEQHGRPVEQGA